MTNVEEPFSKLVKPIRRIIIEKGFTRPTYPQVEAIPIILEGKNVLLIAPTGTGKTEAAFLPIFSNLIQIKERSMGIKVLYITPLRSLNRDLLERLQWWCEKLDIKVAVRHGDTDTKERFTQSKHPPDMLITTPETLQAILPGRNMRRHLSAIRWVIIDEVHEFAEDKRGSQLALCLERLRIIADREFQLIGLSATIGSPERVAQFLVGTNRSVEIVKVSATRYMKFEIVYPTPSKEDFVLANELYTHPEVASRLSIMRKLIEDHRSVLLFTNTRSIAEVLASRFKIWDIDFPVSIHHGSLAKPARITAEKALKDGEIKGLVCTSSLELGIDIGDIDLCIQYMSPRQVTRLVQRVGRSGHKVGRVAKGVIITMDSDDTLEALVIAKKAYLEDLEPVSIPEKPLDALAHQILGLLIHSRQWDFNQLLDIFRKAYPYNTLDEETLIKVLKYMHERYPRLAWVSYEDKVAMRPQKIKEMYQYYYENLSMIPDEKSYLVIDETNELPIGVLDEVFVAEYGDPGTKFIVRGSPWKIINVYGDKIYVKPVDDPTGAIPSWIGEEIPVPFEVAYEVGEIRSLIERKMKARIPQEDIALTLSQMYPADQKTILKAIKEIVEQINNGLQVPTGKRITIEEWTDYIIIHTSFGSLVNRTMAIILGHMLSEYSGHAIGVQEDPYRIIIQTMGKINKNKVKEILKEITIRDLYSLAIESSVKTGIFKRRLIHVARRFGAVSKGADFSSISLNQLTKSFQDTAIFDEAVKETFNKDMDLTKTKQIFEGIDKGEIELTIIKTDSEASPIAKVGLEKISRRSNIISSDRMILLTIESAKARLLSEVKTFVCINCRTYIQMNAIKNYQEKIICPKCGSRKIGILNESEEEVKRIFEKKKSLTQKEKEIIDNASATAELIDKNGYLAALALSGKNLSLSEVEEILSKENKMNNRFIELILEAERRALAKRFW